MGNKSVSLCMIVKNEEKFLEKCLNSVLDIVDEIIIVDTGSTDKTVDIAKKFNAQVFNYEWNDSFSDARNFSLSKATKDWILIMDGDDVFEENDKNKFKDLLKTTEYDGYFFKTISYVMENNTYDFVYNSNLRLLKNNKEYEFIGTIHEQICNKSHETDYSKFKVEDILVHHNGYLPSTVREKDKRSRNIPLIKKELQKNPNNPFHNFNLGNEYMALGELENALQCYNIAYNNMDIKSGYASKLIVKRICCYIETGNYNEVLKEINDALKIYPNNCTLNFYKGYTYQKQRRYTLAIKYFVKCIEIGDENAEFTFLNGCCDFRSYYALGDIFYTLKDYEEAIANYEKSINYYQKSKNPLIYYKLAQSYNFLNNNELDTYNYLQQFFNLSNVDDLILFSLVLSHCKIYNQALQLLLSAQKIENSDRIYIEIGRILIYTNRYNDAIDILRKIPKESTVYDKSLAYKVISKIILEEKINMEEIEMISDINLRKSTLAIYCVLNDFEPPNIDENPDMALKEIINILELILRSKEVYVFEKALNVLNFINSKNVLLELAKMYSLNNYEELAVEEILRSLKVFEVIDRECVEILYYNLTNNNLYSE